MVLTTGTGWARALLRSHKKTPSEKKVYYLFIYCVLNDISNWQNFFHKMSNGQRIGEFLQDMSWSNLR